MELNNYHNTYEQAVANAVKYGLGANSANPFLPDTLIPDYDLLNTRKYTGKCRVEWGRPERIRDDWGKDRFAHLNILLSPAMRAYYAPAKAIPVGIEHFGAMSQSKTTAGSMPNNPVHVLMRFHRCVEVMPMYPKDNLEVSHGVEVAGSGLGSTGSQSDAGQIAYTKLYLDNQVKYFVEKIAFPYVSEHAPSCTIGCDAQWSLIALCAITHGVRPNDVMGLIDVMVQDYEKLHNR